MKNLIQICSVVGMLIISLFFIQPARAQVPEVIHSFDAQALEAPESVTVDFWGNKYISLSLTGEIRKIDPWGNDSTLAVLPLGVPLTPCGLFPVIMGALAIDLEGSLYIPVNSCDESTRGVYRVDQDGSYERIAAFPLEALLNGIALRLGKVYVADSALGVIWRFPKNGGEPEVWSDDPLLAFQPNDFGAPGPNGIQFYLGELYVANPSTFTMLAIPLKWNGKAGPARVHAPGVGCDDFAFDIEGTLYCTTDPFQTVLKVYQDGTTEPFLDLSDGLDGPTSAVFGRLWDRHTLYITNAAFPFFPGNMSPSLMRLEVDVPGYPFR